MEKLETYLAAEIDRYKAERARYYKEGESKGIEIGMPRLFKAKLAEASMILVHGYMAAPEEMANLAEAICGLGINVYLPRLPGHGTGPDNLETVGREDWVKTVEGAYALASLLGGKTIIAGFSTGAGLALHEAGRHPGRYAALISISAPLRLMNRQAPLMRPLDALISTAKKLGLAKAGAGFFPNHPDNPDINYGRNCIHGVAEVERLMDETRRLISAISIPSLVMQGSGDTTVDPNSPKKIFGSLGSTDKRIVIVQSDRHGIVRGPSLPETYAVIKDFLETQGLCASPNP